VYGWIGEAEPPNVAYFVRATGMACQFVSSPDWLEWSANWRSSQAPSSPQRTGLRRATLNGVRGCPSPAADDRADKEGNP
jgi:hypothetical protein